MKRILLTIWVTLLAGLWFTNGCSKEIENFTTTKCIRVIDGDTIVISGGDRVRLIGIDTAEVYESDKLFKDSERTGKDIRIIQALGKQASEYTKKWLDRKTIKLELDPDNVYINHRDKYGRLLAYIYLADGTFFNAQIIKDGYANAYTKFPFKYMDEFRNYEREARESKKGLWAEEAEESPALSVKGEVAEAKYVASKKSKVFHRSSCVWANKIREKNKVQFKTREEAENAGYRPCQTCRP